MLMIRKTRRSCRVTLKYIVVLCYNFQLEKKSLLKIFESPSRANLNYKVNLEDWNQVNRCQIVFVW
jgi:hypothetical protein